MMMFSETPFTGVFIIDLNLYSDNRGWFARTFCKNEFKQIGHDKEWLQINHSCTIKKGTVRGMHFQKPPYTEIKLVRCIAGAIFDVIVDLRKDSETFLQWFGIELSAENKKLLYIPEGFAHGFQALTDNCELIYQNSAFYTPGAEGGINHDDPQININWPQPISLLSERDKSYEYLNNNFKGI